MKKNLSHTSKSCYIDIPEFLFHENNLLSEMLYIFSCKLEKYNYMKNIFSGNCMLCIKKIENTFSSEYYFSNKSIPLKFMCDKVLLPIAQNILNFNIQEYSIEFSKNSTYELNLFDTIPIAYNIVGDRIYMKHSFYSFGAGEIHGVQKLFNNFIYKPNFSELEEILNITLYQRSDGRILVGNKISSQSIFFSNINFQGFCIFIKKYGWDVYVGDFIETNQNYLSYYLFDVNIEIMIIDGKIQVSKTSIYGLL